MAITPGMHAQPGPMTFQVKRTTLPSGQAVVVLHIEHATGATIIPLPTDTALQLGQQLIDSGTGLTVVKEVPH